jgi:transposase
MMGRKGFQGKWFYNFSLEDRVPQDHLLRFVAAAVDFSFVRDLVRDTYSHTGAPSVDPVVIFKMALLGYLYGVTSERRLAQRPLRPHRPRMGSAEAPC